MNPAPPVTRILTPPPRLRADLYLAVIPQHQAVRLAHPGSGGHLDIVPDEGGLDAAYPADRRPGQDDGVLDLAIGDHAVTGDRGERADVRIGHLGTGADDGRSHDPRPADPGSGVDDHPADKLARRVYLAGHGRLGALQHDPVDLQHVRDIAGVLPVTRDDRGADLAAVRYQPLDRLGDLQLSALRRRQGRHRLVDRGREQVHPDQRQIALGLLRLLLQADELARAVELGDPELPRVRYRGEHDVGIGPGGTELLHQRGDAAHDEVVTQVHHEVIVAEELPGHQDRVRQAERG